MTNSDNPHPAPEPREEDDIGNPYPGLRPFEENDSRYFSGRDTQKQELLKRLATNRFVAVMGSSGSGKSSLVKAGLIPLLKANYVPAEMKPAPWKILIMTPGSNPLLNLAITIRNEFPESIGQQSEEDLQESLRLTLEDGLAEVIDEDEDSKDHNILLVIDQFEELFTHEDTDSSEFKAVVHNDRSDFVALVLETINQTRRDIFVVTTMRSEYLGECASYIGLSEAFGKAVFIVPMLSIDEMREAIVKPASKVGVRVDRKLVDKIIHDVETELDQLPVLQNSLHLMFENKVSAGHPDFELTLDDYQDLKTALDTFAEDIYKGRLKDGSVRPNWKAQDKLHSDLLFRNICIRDITGERVRRPATIKQLMRVTGMKKREIIKVVNVFRADGCNFLTPFKGKEPELTPATEINIVHESLIRKWKRLKRWVDREAGLADSFRRHCKAALDWRKHGERNADLALGGLQFESLTRWFQQKNNKGGLNKYWCSRHWDASWEKEYGTPQNFDYLKLLRVYKKTSEHVRSRNKKYFWGSVAFIAILVISFTGITYYQGTVTEDERIKAENEKNFLMASSFATNIGLRRTEQKRGEPGKSQAPKSNDLPLLFAAEAARHLVMAQDWRDPDRICQTISHVLQMNFIRESSELECKTAIRDEATGKRYLKFVIDSVCQRVTGNIGLKEWFAITYDDYRTYRNTCKELISGPHMYVLERVSIHRSQPRNGVASDEQKKRDAEKLKRRITKQLDSFKTRHLTHTEKYGVFHDEHGAAVTWHWSSEDVYEEVIAVITDVAPVAGTPMESDDIQKKYNVSYPNKAHVQVAHYIAANGLPDQQGNAVSASEQDREPVRETTSREDYEKFTKAYADLVKESTTVLLKPPAQPVAEKTLLLVEILKDKKWADLGNDEVVRNGTKARALSEICLCGIAYDKPDLVLPACDKAVELSSGKDQESPYRRYRGMVYAMKKEITKARKDLEGHANWISASLNQQGDFNREKVITDNVRAKFEAFAEAYNDKPDAADFKIDAKRAAEIKIGCDQDAWEKS